jgi:hypothetical protein
MAFRDTGNPPIQSTGIASTAIAVNQSSAAVAAAIVGLQDRLYEARFCVGADTVAFWKLQHTNAAGSVLRDQKVVITGTNQTSEFIFTYKAEANDVLQVMLGTAIGSSFVAAIQAEVMS